MNVNVSLNPRVKRTEAPLKTGHFSGSKSYISIPALTIGAEGGQANSTATRRRSQLYGPHARSKSPNNAQQKKINEGYNSTDHTSGVLGFTSQK